MDKWVNVGRPGPWGNPYQVGRDGSRLDVVTRHREWWYGPDQAPLRARAVAELTGKLLWCPGCRGTLPCHKTVIEETVWAARAA